MTGGWISGNRELVMPIRLLDANEHVHRIEANIDTGFNGHLTLPPDLLRLLSLIAAKPLDLRMANDATETFPTFQGDRIVAEPTARGPHYRVGRHAAHRDRPAVGQPAHR